MGGRRRAERGRRRMGGGGYSGGRMGKLRDSEISSKIFKVFTIVRKSKER